MPGRSPSILVWTLLTAGTVASCTDRGPIAPRVDRSFTLSFAVGAGWAGLFDPSEVDAVRGVALSTSSGDTLGRFERTWDPLADPWSIELDAALPHDIVGLTLQVELLGGGAVQWSGRSDPIRRDGAAAPTEVTLALYRGPIPNLSVTSVVMAQAPASLDEGTSAQLSAQLAGGDPSTLAAARVFWHSTDPTVASVAANGLVTGHVPGTVSILAVAGPAADTAVIDIEVVPSDLILDPPTARLTSIAERVRVEAVVVDARGDTLSGFSLLWESTDSAVLEPVGDGVFEAVANGDAQVVASLIDRPGVQAQTAVEVSQELASLTLTPMDSVVVGAGTDVQFVARALDANGYPVGGATFTWSSSNGAVATIDTGGLASTQGQGVTTIRAETIGGAWITTELTVLPVGGVTQVWVGGDAAGPREWASPGNWLPRRVPTLVDSVLIQASAVDQPRLSSDQSVALLTVENAASVELAGFTLTVTGDLQAGQTLVGPGSVRMTGPGASVAGAVPNLFVNGTVALSGPLQVTGALTVAGTGADLDVGAHTVAVSGALRVQDGATLSMGDAASVVDVDGEAVFDGASTLGRLTAGELRVGGNFTAWTSGAQSFAPTGAHKTVLDGAVVQTVYLHYSGVGEARFHDLEVDNPGGVILHSTIRVTNDLVLTQGTLSGSQTVELGGDLTEVVGGNQYRVLNTILPGSSALPTSVQTNVTFTGAYSLARDLEVVGSVVVSGSGATLGVGGHSVTVSGDFSTQGGGTLTMQDASGVLDVGGLAFFDGASTLGLLTAGELRVARDFTAWMADPQSFAPTGTHRTVLDGSVGQAVYLHHNGAGQSRFQQLDVDNPAGVALHSTVRVTDDLTLVQGTLTGAQTVILGGDLTEVLGSNQYQVLNTVLTGSPVLPTSLQSNVTFAGAYAATRDLEVIGSVIVTGVGASLTVGSHGITVTGSFTTDNGGTLVMQSASGLLTVTGDAFFHGASTTGLLTAGELRVGGNFTAWTSDPENFSPSGAHVTTLDGTAMQTVYFYHNGANQSRFQDVVVTNPSGASFVDTVRVSGALTVSTALTVAAGNTALVAGHFTLEAPATLTNDGTVQANSCSLLGTVNGNAPVCGGGG